MLISCCGLFLATCCHYCALPTAPVLSVSFPKCCLCELDFSNSSSLSLAAFMAQEAFALLTLTWLFGSCCPAHLSAVTVQLFPHFPFYSFVNCLAEGMPVRINQGRSPSVFLNLDARFQRFDFLGSQCQLVCSFPEGRLWIICTEIRPLCTKRPSCASDLRPLALWLSISMKLLSPSMIPFLLLSCRPVTML